MKKTFDIWYDNMSLIQTKRKCQAKPLKKKYEALQEVAKGVPKSTAARKYNVRNNTLSTRIKNKDKMMQFYRQGARYGIYSRGGGTNFPRGFKLFFVLLFDGKIA